MLEDEARFGRITDPKRCWAPKGIRPLVNKQIIREYTYAYGAVSPLDGISDFIILPSMSAACMNLFLAELADRHPDEFILLISDCAPSHSEGALKIPDNIMIAFLPPYSPELNPVENNLGGSTGEIVPESGLREYGSARRASSRGITSTGK